MKVDILNLIILSFHCLGLSASVSIYWIHFPPLPFGENLAIFALLRRIFSLIPYFLIVLGFTDEILILLGLSISMGQQYTDGNILMRINQSTTLAGEPCGNANQHQSQ